MQSQQSAVPGPLQGALLAASSLCCPFSLQSRAGILVFSEGGGAQRPRGEVIPRGESSEVGNGRFIVGSTQWETKRGYNLLSEKSLENSQPLGGAAASPAGESEPQGPEVLCDYSYGVHAPGGPGQAGNCRLLHGAWAQLRPPCHPFCW